MKIHNGTKKIDLTAIEEKKPLILSMHEKRKIIITKNKKKTENEQEKTYYSYQLNIPND